MTTPLEELPKKIQYINVDSQFVTGTNNTFTVSFGLESNTHIQDMSRVIGIKVAEFYITQVGGNSNVAGSSNIAKFVDVLCPDVPRAAQILDERSGQILIRVPLERHFTGSNNVIVRDKQWKPMQRKWNLFNPISIKQLDFIIKEYQDDGDYVLLHPDAKWHMVLEITTIDVKKKTPNRELQILDALERLIGKIDILNANVKRLPEKPPDAPKKKYPFGVLMAVLLSMFGGFVWFLNKSGRVYTGGSIA